MNLVTLSNAADWHATMAIKAYRKRDYETYRRHIKLCDTLRATVQLAVADFCWGEAA